MRISKKITTWLVISSWLLTIRTAYPTELRDTRITPTQGAISGEYVHGSIIGGKLLIKILFFGAVPTQGIHYIPEGTDLLSAILYAGGYNDTSKINGISIRRRNQKELIKIDLEEIIEEGLDAPKLLDDDVITIPYNWRRDIATISLITSFVTSISAFTTTLIVLVRR